MRIQLYTLRNKLEENLELTLQKLAQLGFLEVELFGYDGFFYGKTAEEFKILLDQFGLKAISSHHQTGVTQCSRGTFLNDWESTIEDLKILGIQYAVCSYLQPNERTLEHYKQLPNILEEAAEKAKHYNIEFAYHHHDFEFEKIVPQQSYFDYILENTSPNLVKIEVDFYWMAKANIKPIDYFEKHEGRFPLWHLKDMQKDTKNFTEIGNGVIDWLEIFELKNKAGLKYWFIEQDECEGDEFESIARSKKWLEENL